MKQFLTLVLALPFTCLAQTFTDNGSVSSTTDFIGIGTSNPNHNLHVFGAGQFGEQNAHFGIGGSTGARIGIRHSVANGFAPMLLMVHTGRITWDMGVHYDQSFRIRNFDGNSFPFTILQNGFVGIGTTSPSQKLDVVGNAEINGSIYANGDVYIGDSGSGRLHVKQDGFSSNNGLVITNGNSQSIRLWVDTDNTRHIGRGSNSALAITTDYKVGIGTTTPTEKLSVNGTIRSKEVKVEVAPWPDYVFAEDYELKSLQEMKAFIKENKRLPYMPSAEEVAENGIALGEMNRLLLEKVEELTLYLIAKDDQMNQVLKSQKELLKRLENLESSNQAKSH